MKQTLTTLGILIVIGALAVLVTFLFGRNDRVQLPTQQNPIGSTSSKLPAGSTPPGDPDFIRGSTFVWTEGRFLINGDGPVRPLKSDAFTITFSMDGQVSGTTDCNSFSGTYQIGSEGVITFGPIASTKMYCEGSQEEVFLNLLSKINHYQVIGNLGVVILDSDEVMMVFNKQ